MNTARLPSCNDHPVTLFKATRSQLLSATHMPGPVESAGSHLLMFSPPLTYEETEAPAHCPQGNPEVWRAIQFPGLPSAARVVGAPSSGGSGEMQLPLFQALGAQSGGGAGLVDFVTSTPQEAPPLFLEPVVSGEGEQPTVRQGRSD